MLKTCAKFFLAVVVTCLVFEVFLQSASIQTLSLADYTSEGILLKKNRPFVFFKEGFSVNRTNNQGILGDDVALVKPAGVLRIALLGDSFTEGLQVFARDHFRSILQSRLEELYDGRPVEVLNFGRSGYDLNDSYAYYRTFVEKYEPDRVLLILSESDLKQPKRTTITPLCYLDDQHKIALDTTYLNTSYYQKKLSTQYRRGYSAIADIIQKCWDIVREGGGSQILLGKFYKPKRGKQSDEREVMKLSEVTKAILGEMQQKGVIIVLHGDFPQEHLEYIRYNSSCVIDLKEPLQSLYREQGSPYYWKGSGRNGHWNQDAHLAIGEYLAKRLYSAVLSAKT